MLETMGSNMTDCTQWLRPAAPLILSDNLASYISCYHLQIPQTPENAWYAEYVNTTATQNFIKNVWLAGRGVWLVSVIARAGLNLFRKYYVSSKQYIYLRVNSITSKGL